MKLLVVCQYFHPEQFRVNDICFELVRRGHDVTVLVANPARRTTSELMNGVRVIKAARWATVASTPISPALFWQAARAKADIAHLHFPHPPGEVANWLLHPAKRTIISYHSDVVRQTSILRFYKPLMKRVLKKADAIIYGSPPMRKQASPSAQGAIQSCRLRNTSSANFSKSFIESAPIFAVFSA